MLKSLRSPCTRFVSLLALFSLVSAARANDSIFPPAPAAASAVSFDGKGFLIGGKRTFLASGSVHYARVPRALWRDRLLRMKRAGFNTVQTYCFWNYHEPKEGQFEFSGEKDLGAFLDLAHDLGLYAIVRVGPYCCAEWEFGGYPVWLAHKPGVRVREDNPAFLASVDRYFEHLLPIVAARQAHRGGSVIMVQLENEHPLGWGTDMPNGYFTHLREKAKSLGIEVPAFFSGLHHGSDPAGNAPWDSAGRANPWFSTEFWAGWFDLYGGMPPDRVRFFTRAVWKMLAYGGNGYNDYMLHGGSNFGFTNNNEDDASYDYGAAIGQAGELWPLYYRFKRANWFARSFQDILENSTNATATYRSFARNVNAVARTSPAGTIVFLDNPGASAYSAYLPSGVVIRMDPAEIVPIVLDYELLPSIRIEQASTRIFGVARQGDTATLVVYGPPGDEGEVRFRTDGGTAFGEGAPAFTRKPDDPNHFTLRFRFPADAPETYLYTKAGEQVRVVAMSTAMTDRTWFANTNGREYVVYGPEFLSDLSDGAEGLRVAMERPVGSATRAATVWGRMDDDRRLEATATGPAPTVAPPTLSSWEARPGDPEAARAFEDAAWLATDTPKMMGADGDTSAYAWYRAKVSVPEAGDYQLVLGGAQDRARLYVNGESVATGTRAAQVHLSAGENGLAIFTAHDGRDKLFNYLGPLDTASPKGLTGPVTLSSPPTSSTRLSAWRMRAVSGTAETDAAVADSVDTSGADWQDSDATRDAFNGRAGFVVYRALLPAVSGGHREVWFDNVDENGTVYLNGTKIGEHRGWGQPFAVTLDPAWRADGPNNLAVVVENTNGPGGIMGAVRLDTYAGTTGAANGAEVRGWRMRGGIGPEDPATGWQPFTGATGRPAFYRARFTLPAVPEGVNPVYRITWEGLSRGFIWLNGHNLGRCPDRLTPSLYMPEPWLLSGENTIVVFDENGRAPTAVRIVTDANATRQALTLAQSGS